MSDSVSDRVAAREILDIYLRKTFLRAQSDTPPTDGECRALEALIRCQLLLEKVPLPSDDAFPNQTPEELRALLK